jgi:hypothetical protein
MMRAVIFESSHKNDHGRQNAHDRHSGRRAA